MDSKFSLVLEKWQHINVKKLMLTICMVKGNNNAKKFAGDS
jgi:hypothetical protein